MSKIISHTREGMERSNASFTKYPRVTHYVRETHTEFTHCVQAFKDLHMLTQRKPVKVLASGYLLNDGHSAITGYGQ